MELLLKGGTVYDGTGNKPYTADILMDGDRISAIAPTLDSAAPALDCRGYAVAPGFIDNHSHNDWFTHLGEEYYEPFILQGITTQVTGNCGFSPFGFSRATPHRKYIGGGLFPFDEHGDYSTFASWASENAAPPINLIPLHGHGTSRIGISGLDNRPLTEAELSQLLCQTETAMDQGAFGASLGLMYIPGMYAPYEELRRVAEAVAKRHLVLSVHARAYSCVSTSYSPPIGGRPHNLRALDEMIRLCEDTGVKLQYSHLIFVGSATWRTVDPTLEAIDAARARGLDIAFDIFPMTFGATGIATILPPWYLALNEAQRKALPSRVRLALEIYMSRMLLGFDFGDIQIAWVSEDCTEFNGMTVADIAKRIGKSHLHTYLQLIDLSGGHGRALMHRYSNDDVIAQLLRHPACIGITDAWLEDSGVQNAATFGAFPRFLELARSRRTIGLPEMVRKLTGAAADRVGADGYGYLKAGQFANAVVFDPEAVGFTDGRVQGIRAVVLNGKPVAENGVLCGSVKNAGRLVRRA